MDFTANDFQQTEQIGQIIQFCDGANNKQLEQIVDEIYRNQPFLISLFLGYKDDVTQPQHDEILRVLIIIWLFFKDNKNVKRQQINDSLFEEKQKQNLQFLNYLSGEHSWNAQQLTTDINLSRLKSKALFTAALFKIKEGKSLKKLDEHTRAIIILAMKSLIEAFEDVYSLKRPVSN